MSHRRIIGPVERIDLMLAKYAKLERDAHRLLDGAVELYLSKHPEACSRGIVKLQEFTGRCGYMLNIPAALRILRGWFKDAAPTAGGHG